MKLKVYRSPANKQWYFRIVAKNGKIVAQSEGYKRVGSALQTLNSVLSPDSNGALQEELSLLMTYDWRNRHTS